MARLTTDARKRIDKAACAFPRERKEPLENASHVRNAVARFNQVEGVTDGQRDAAWKRIKAAGKKFGVEITEMNWREIGNRRAFSLKSSVAILRFIGATRKNFPIIPMFGNQSVLDPEDIDKRGFRTREICFSTNAGKLAQSHNEIAFANDPQKEDWRLKARGQISRIPRLERANKTVKSVLKKGIMLAVVRPT